MRSTRLMSRGLIFLLILLNTGCDQLTKHIARSELNYHETIPVIPHFFTFIKVENYGAFLSSGDQLPAMLKFVLLSLLPLGVLAYGLYFVMSRRDLKPSFALGIGFVIGGGAGNLYDRFLHNSVTDFMHLDFYLFQTGIFNVADLSIMSGMVLILIDQYLLRKTS